MEPQTIDTAPIDTSISSALARIDAGPSVKRGTQLSDEALAYVAIDSEHVLMLADTLMGDLKLAEKAIEADHENTINAARGAWKAALAHRDRHLDPVQKARTHLSGLMTTYQREREAIARRQEAELQEQANAAHQQQTIEAAAQAEALGDHEAAKAILEDGIESQPTVSIAVAPVKLENTSFRKTFKARVTSLKMLAGAVLAGHVPLIAIEANEKYLNQRARADGKALRIPGVEVYEDIGTATRASR